MIIDCQQWEIIGMLACLLQIDEQTTLAESLRIEAYGEGLKTEFNAGEAEMSIWLRHYRRVPTLAAKGRPMVYLGGFPLTLH